jgi:NADPH:quinone reductase-like Zn-dependent oxidoreductase
MTAVTFASFGGPEVLTSGTIARPEPGPDEVLVRVRACGVNPADANLRSGRLRWFTRGPFPRSLGADVAGEVVEAGGGFAEGERVFGMLDPIAGRGYAQFAAAPARLLARIPDGVTFAQAAAVPLAGLTAWQALTRHAEVAAGARVLIRGASGGVGGFAVQLARHLGAEVTGLASAERLDWVTELGAHHVMDYAALSWEELGGYDAVVDVRGELPWSIARALLTERGTYVTLTPSLSGFALDPIRRRGRGRRRLQMLVEPSGEEVAALAELMARGVLSSTTQHTLPLERAAHAHELIEGAHTKGKIVLEVP